MNSKYSKEFKSSIIARLLPPQNVSVPDMVKETGIPRDTLYTWKRKYRNLQGEPDTNQIQQTGRLTNEEKLSVVIETASLSEVEGMGSGMGSSLLLAFTENCDINHSL